MLLYNRQETTADRVLKPRSHGTSLIVAVGGLTDKFYEKHRKVKSATLFLTDNGMDFAEVRTGTDFSQ